MVRLVELTLDGVRNVSHGTIGFDDLESGGSVTGIYGQNGSGKTSVIDVIDILRHLIAGRALPEGSADAVSADTNEATITAIYRMAGHEGAISYLEYAVTLTGRHESRVARVSGESLRIGSDPKRMGRPIMERRREADDVTRLPAYVWRSLLSIGDIRSDADFFDRADQFEGMSFLFAPYRTVSRRPDDADDLMMGHFIDRALAEKGLSARTVEYLTSKMIPTVALMRQLADYARNDVYVSTTRRSSMASYQYVPIADVTTGKTMLLDLLGPNLMTDDQLERLRGIIGTYDLLLPTLVPNLKLSLAESPAPSDEQGNHRTQVEIMSSRGGTAFPFRNESEGIIRITMLLSFYIRAYNDPNVLVAIDELDSGVFENLLGDMLRQIVSGIRGQLIFTAHNQHPLAVLPGKCMRTTVVDPDDRFSRGPRIKTTNNGHSVYHNSVDLGWDGPDLYDAPPARMFANALFRAGHPKTKPGADHA
ncbi:AAA family ATPase [Bifidobacterium aerophilum]|uniref:AAA family ATPase n=1 Tax=Bifidobacterium aerophilum TaxID=1798155 RepID=A0A6N9Z545_9BIFI|nr:AAA family ATPase [Bifidobacterium aerophilum]NEG89474.1 AAA family ATPase [Bifidobacterium aerophilum]